MCTKGKRDAVRAVGGAPSKGKAESLTTKTVPVQRAAYKTGESFAKWVPGNNCVQENIKTKVLVVLILPKNKSQE